MSRVIGKRSLGKSETFDLTVSKNQNFFANGIVVHNCSVVIDEANIGRRSKAIHERGITSIADRTEAIYQAIRRRIRMTFNKGGPPTLLFTLGSRRYPSDFTDRRIHELKGNRKAMVIDLSVWDARGRENFSEKTFRVMVGNESTASKILKDGEEPLPGFHVIDVPEDFRSDFDGDIEGSLRDIGGIAVRTISPFFASHGMLQAMLDDSRVHPVKTVEWRVDQPLVIEWDRLVLPKDGKMVPILGPDKPRCVAIDLGRVKNPTGICLGFIQGYKTVVRKDPTTGRIMEENLPSIVVEFALRITPVRGEEVKFWQVRQLVFDFIQHGIPVRMAVLDHWQCLTGDVKVILLSGEEVPIRDLAVRYPNGQHFWVYSYDPMRRKVVPGKARAVGKTGIGKPVVEVELDNGWKIRCTDTHPFMLIDGTYLQAKDLKPGDSLLALYRGISNRGRDSMTGYDFFRRPEIYRRKRGVIGKKAWQYTHRYEKVLGRVYRSRGLKVRENHKVVAVRPAGHEDVYDVTVEEYSNFAIVAGAEESEGIGNLNSGIFVHNSDDSVQLLQDQGIEASKIKVDYKAYDNLKSAVYEGRVRVYSYKPLIDELMLLEDDPKRRKVDIFSEDTGNTHHDVADALCLLVNLLSKNFKASDYAPVAPEFDLPNRKQLGGPYQSLPVDGPEPFSFLPGEKMASSTLPSGEDRFNDYGFVFGDRDVGWGESKEKKDLSYIALNTSKPIVRVEILANEFCAKVGIEKLESVPSSEIKAFLFEKGLTEPRLVDALRTHVERVYSKKII